MSDVNVVAQLQNVVAQNDDPVSRNAEIRSKHVQGSKPIRSILKENDRKLGHFFS